MTRRALLGGILAVIGIAALTGVFAQRQRLMGLRTEQARLLSGLAPMSEISVSAPTPAGSGRTKADSIELSPPLELLRLRNQVHQLTERRRELEGVARESQQLRAQLAAHGVNVSATAGLPPGYVLRSKAQWAGFSSPADAIQSFLWAMQNRDFTNLLLTMTPESGRRLLTQMQQGGQSLDKLFGDDALPGLRILGQEQEPTGAVQLRVEIVPGQPLPEPIRVRQIDGQWKLDGPF